MEILLFVIVMTLIIRFGFEMRSAHRSSYIGEMGWFFKENRSTLDKMEVFFRYTLTFSRIKRFATHDIRRLSKYYWYKFLVKNFGKEVYEVDAWQGITKRTVLVFNFNEGIYFSEGTYKFSNKFPIKNETFIDLDMAVQYLETLMKQNELKTY